MQALREDAPPLEDQLAKLAGDRHAEIEVAGMPRPLPPDVSLALYRVAQEALTNAVKHAPGAATTSGWASIDERVSLSVANGPRPCRWQRFAPGRFRWATASRESASACC